MSIAKDDKRRIILKKHGVRLWFNNYISDDTLNKIVERVVNHPAKYKYQSLKRQIDYMNHVNDDDFSYDIRLQFVLLTKPIDRVEFKNDKLKRLPMNIFQTINPRTSSIEALYRKAEAELDSRALDIYISNSKDISYRIDDKKPIRYCYVCNQTKEETLFSSPYNDGWAHGVRPFCSECKRLPSKKREARRREIERKAREEKQIKLLALREETLAKDKVRKEIRDREARDREKLYRAEKELYRCEYFWEHGVYPTSSKSDNNVIYVWKDTIRENIYKIGISSKRVGTKRIYEVASGANMRAEILHYEEVENALALEKELLKYGEAINFDRKFDGCTEFRHLTCDDLIAIEELINIYKIEY